MLEWQITEEHRSREALAIIGLHMGLLFWIDRGWLGENAASLFNLREVEESPHNAHGWAAWNAFLIWVRPHFEYYRLFEDQFRYAVEQSAAVEPGKKSEDVGMEHLGEHLMVLYARGQLTIEQGSATREFLDRAHPDFRRSRDRVCWAHLVEGGRAFCRDGRPNDGPLGVLLEWCGWVRRSPETRRLVVRGLVRLRTAASCVGTDATRTLRTGGGCARAGPRGGGSLGTGCLG